MAAEQLVGIDLGGSGVRVLLLDLARSESQVVSRPWRFERVAGTGGLGYTLDLDALWSTTAAAVREVLSRADVAPASVRGLAVSALRFACVVIDAAGEPVFAVPNRDARAAGEGFELAATHGDAMLAETGLWPLPIHASARLRWLRKHEPTRIEPGHTLLSLGDWLNLRLCGARVTDFSQAGCTGLFGLATRRWSDARIAEMQLPRALFPEVVESGTKLGGLDAHAARRLGLHAGTVVGLAGADTQCALLGAGAVNSGDLAVVAGTTAPLQAVVDEPVIDPAGRLFSGHHVIPRAGVLESNGGPMGEALTWIARVLHPEASSPEAAFFDEADRAAVGSAGLLSTLGGEVMNARAPRMPCGQMILTHMSSAHDPAPRRHLARSIVEGHACAVRANAEQLAGVLEQTPDRLRLTGGLSRSDVFAQMIADIGAVEVKVTRGVESSALGAALCAGVASGAFGDFTEAVERGVRMRRTFEPRPSHAQPHAELYTAWCALREAARETTAPFVAGHLTPWVLREGQLP